MNSKQFLQILEKEAPKMELHKALSIIKEWDNMREDLGKYEMVILYALKMLGFDDNCNPTKNIENISEREAQALQIMMRVHGGFSCGIPGMSENLKHLHEKYPIDKNNLLYTSDLFKKFKTNE